MKIKNVGNLDQAVAVIGGMSVVKSGKSISVSKKDLKLIDDDKLDHYFRKGVTFEGMPSRMEKSKASEDGKAKKDAAKSAAKSGKPGKDEPKPKASAGDPAPSSEAKKAGTDPATDTAASPADDPASDEKAQASEDDSKPVPASQSPKAPGRGGNTSVNKG